MINDMALIFRNNLNLNFGFLLHNNYIDRHKLN